MGVVSLFSAFIFSIYFQPLVHHLSNKSRGREEEKAMERINGKAI